MKIQTRSLDLELLSYWQAGTGLSSGQHVDALAEKDAHGLPFVSGRHLKGLLRHAVRRAEEWGWFKDLTPPPPDPNTPFPSWSVLLFGSAAGTEIRFKTKPGMLLINDARLDDALHAWLSLPTQAAHRQALYQNLFSTAIDEFGIAREHTLRGIEVCLPVNLSAEVRLTVTAVEERLRQQQITLLEHHAAQIWQCLEQALPLIDSIGANRTRGFGEVVATFGPIKEVA